jgi:ubiquinone/menaquinone biosynthesis C-methylase UbiE
LAQAIPQAEITAIDWQAVLAVAERNAALAGISQRYHTIAGSAFEMDWGDNFDLVLLANFLHHFDEDTCVALLTKARSSLKSGGKVVAVEFVPNEDRVSPSRASTFSFMMLGSTPNGDAYTAHQFEDMARKAGFSATAVKAVPPTPMSLVTIE